MGDNIPQQRRYTRALPGALNVDAAATDDDSGQAFQMINQDNEILDIFSDPAPGAGILYQIRLLKNNVQTGRTYFSGALNTASAGRSDIGPVALSPGQISYMVRQTLGALAIYNFVVKYSSSF